MDYYFGYYWRTFIQTQNIWKMDLKMHKMKKLIPLILLTALVGCGQIFDTELNCVKTPETSFPSLNNRSYILGTSSMQIIESNESENYQCEITRSEKNVIKCNVYTDYEHIYVFYNKLNGIISDKRVRFDSDLNRDYDGDYSWIGTCTKA